MKCIYHAYISHVSRYSLDQKRSRFGLVSDTRGSRLGLVSDSLANVSVSGAQVSDFVSVSTQKVLGPSLLLSIKISIKQNSNKVSLGWWRPAVHKHRIIL